METYDVNINSNKRAVLVAIAFYGLSVYLMTLIPTGWPKFLVFLGVATLFFAPMLAATILSRGKIRIELTEDSFRIRWVKRFFLSSENDIELGWDRIIDYVNQEDRGLDSFRLTLTNKQQLKFYRYTFFPQKDDFTTFLREFPNFLRHINRTNAGFIGLGKTVFQTRSFKWLLIVMTAVTVVLLLAKIQNPNFSTGWPTLGVLGTALMFYWTQVRRRT